MTVWLAAYWGLGEAALAVAGVLLVGYMLQGWRAWARSGQLLVIVGEVFLGAALILRGVRGHGWPITFWPDMAAGIGVVMLLVYLVWSSATRNPSTGAVTVPVALGLSLLGAAQQVTAPVTTPMSNLNLVLSSGATLLGGAFWGLSASIGLSGLIRLALKTRFIRGCWLPARVGSRWSEIWVRGGLIFLAIGLAIDVWWVKPLDLVATDNVRQGGIAIAWMIYFIALRLKNHPRWQGWAWDAIQVIGFACTLPILLDVPWLNQPLIFW